MSTQLSSQRAAVDGIRLTDVLPGARVVGAQDIVFRSCCGSWQDCQTDDLYVAIVDADHDGHEFTHEAVARGAHAVVTERLLTTRRPECIVPDTREAYGKICQALAGKPSQHLSTIAVSGSDGKTVTSHLIRSIFQAAEQKAGLATSMEVELGQNCSSVPAKEVTSPRLAEQLTQMALANCQHAIFEVPSVALAQRCLAGVDLDVAVLTNIRMNALGFHGSPANYRRAQLRLLEHLKPTGVAIVNADDPTSHFLLERIDSPTLTFGVRQEAQLTAKLLDRGPSEQTIMLIAGSESVPVRTRMVGDQHIYNCLAAAATCLSQGIDLATIAAGLEQLEHLPGRLERLECGQPFGVWVDSARTPNQLATAIRTVSQVARGRVWCVASVDPEQSSAHRQRLGEVLERACDQPVLSKTYIEKNVDYEPFHQVLDGFDNPGEANLIPNRFRAIEYVLQNAQPGDAVLITGCGERPFALIGDQNWTINDRDVCEAWLYDHASLWPASMNDGLEPGIFNIDDYR